MDFEKSRIERLKRALYSRDEKQVPQEHRTPVQPSASDVQRDWGDRPSFDISYEAMTAKKQNSFFDNFLGISIIFFCISLAVAIFIFFGGLNMISSNNVDVRIAGPSSVSSGEQLSADVSIVNTNRTDLQNVTLFIEYPPGARVAGSDDEPLTRDKVVIGDIKAGATIHHSLQALFFGETNSVQSVKLRLEYNVKGSSAVFSKDKNYDVSIGSSSLILNVTSPKEVNSGQNVALSISITSNSSTIISNTLVKVEYPYGFTYTSSNSKPIRDGVWNIGDLKNGDKKTIVINGTLVGQNTEERTFTVSVGTQSNMSRNDFETKLAESNTTVGIKKSFFDLSFGEGSGNTDMVLNEGDSATVRAVWKNTLPEKVVNARIQAVMSGNVFDRSSVVAGGGGFYRSGDSTIIWDKTSQSKLAELIPGDSGDASLTVSPYKDTNVLRLIKNPYIDVVVTMMGNRQAENSETISSEARLHIKFKSRPTLSARSYRSIGGLTNIGPIPPRADQESTYTINWQIANTTNDLKNAVVSATLPQGVRWLGDTTPDGERIVYNEDTRQVIWSVGSVSAGAGYSYSPKQVSFRVGITPSVTFVGAVMDIVSPAQMSAMDTYASTTVYANALGATTRFADPDFKTGNDTVVK